MRRELLLVGVIMLAVSVPLLVLLGPQEGYVFWELVLVAATGGVVVAAVLLAGGGQRGSPPEARIRQ